MPPTVTEAPTAVLAPKAAIENVRAMFKAREAELAQALPKGIPVSYMIRVVLTAVQRTPKLLECHPITLLGAVFQAAQLGLVPDGVLGQAYLVPYKNTKKNRLECQFIPGYRGLITLVRRSGELSTIDAEVVRAKDKFSYARGLNPTIEHTPYEGEGDAGPLIYVYAIARLKDGSYAIKVMNRREVEAIKARSSGVRSGQKTPWDTDEAWMWKKTALKQITKLLPASIESQHAIGLDDRAEIGAPQDLGVLAGLEEDATPDDDGNTIDAETVPQPQRASETKQGTGSVDGGDARRTQPSEVASPAGSTPAPSHPPNGRLTTGETVEVLGVREVPGKGYLLVDVARPGDALVLGAHTWSKSVAAVARDAAKHKLRVTVDGKDVGERFPPAPFAITGLTVVLAREPGQED